MNARCASIAACDVKSSGVVNENVVLKSTYVILGVCVTAVFPFASCWMVVL